MSSTHFGFECDIISLSSKKLIWWVDLLGSRDRKGASNWIENVLWKRIINEHSNNVVKCMTAHFKLN